MSARPHYLALGDSVSIDHYPDLDAWAKRILETDLGAASLLYSNNDTVWPEFSKKDLLSRQPDLAFINAAEDGAKVEDLRSQMEHARGEDVRLITITAGGNDLLLAYELADTPATLRLLVNRQLARFAANLQWVRSAFPRALILLGTVYDPSDGTGFLSPYPDPLPLEALEQMNNGMRIEAKNLDPCVVVDVHAHFLGHGLSVEAQNRWYLAKSPIEPNMRGASEVRRLWLDALNVRPETRCYLRPTLDPIIV